MKREVKAERIVDFLAAGYSGFVVRTAEAKRGAQILTNVVENYKRKDGKTHKVFEWDLDSSKKPNPADAIEELTKAPKLSVAILHNFHWYLKAPPIIQKIQNSIESWQHDGKALIILTPYPEIPLEIRKDFMLLELPLPDETEIRSCMHHIANSAGKPELMKGNIDPVIQAAKGLTKSEIENVFALSYVTTMAFDIATINEQKIQTIEKSGLIEVLRTKKTYNDILGYDKAKNIVGKMIKKRTSKGVLLVGPPGCGKTTFIECTVGHFKKIGILINFGRLYSKYQGEGSSNVEEIIDIIEAVGDCVVIMDEFEKQFAGAGSTGETDSGVARRMTGRWLEFMQNRPEGVYLMGTCNSFKGIPDEYFRPGRWDSSPLYIGIPNDTEKDAILSHYIKKFKLNGDRVKSIPEMPDWTGAEIEACCAMANNMECTLAEAAMYIIPQNMRGFAEAEEIKAFSIPATSEEEFSKHRKMDMAK